MHSQPKRTILLIAWFALVALACNLSNTSAPPTVVPRNIVAPGNPTPQATLGLQAPSTNLNGSGAGSTGQDSVDEQLFRLMNQVQADRLYRHVEALVNVRTRHVNSSQTSPNEGIGAAYRYITDQMLEIQNAAPERFVVVPDGYEFEAFTGDGKGSIQRNVIAVLTGTELGAGTIVIGAHYDSRTDDLLDATSNAPGAADNGSGVAVVIELARVLSQQPQRSTIIFALFSAEEHNRQGSKAFVQNYIVPNNIDVIAMINVDTVGSWNDSRGNINDRQMRIFSSTKDTSRQLARTASFISYNYNLNLEVVLEDAIDRDGRYGDHFSFDEAGYPAIRFIEAVEDSFNREGRDTLEHVEVKYMVDAAQTILGVVSSLAGGPRPPRNISLRDAGSGTQQLVWEPVVGAERYVVALRLQGSLAYNTQFIEIDSFTEPWDQWRNYAGLAIAAVDANGVIGPLSPEYPIR